MLGIRIGLSAPLADRPYCRFCGSFANELRNARGAGIFCLFSSLLLSSPFFFLSLLVVTQIRGHIAGSSPPLPTTVRALHFYREKISALSSLVDSRRIVPLISSTGLVPRNFLFLHLVVTCTCTFNYLHLHLTIIPTCAI